jgi:hypothetical protein
MAQECEACHCTGTCHNEFHELVIRSTPFWTWMRSVLNAAAAPQSRAIAPPVAGLDCGSTDPSHTLLVVDLKPRYRVAIASRGTKTAVDYVTDGRYREMFRLLPAGDVGHFSWRCGRPKVCGSPDGNEFLFSVSAGRMIRGCQSLPY